MTTQLPKEVYQKAKEWLAEKSEDMGDGQRTQFAVKQREQCFPSSALSALFSTLACRIT